MIVQNNKQISNRLKRCAGQLKKVEELVENGEDCTVVIPQLLAVKGALNATVVSYLEAAMAECAETARPDDIIAVFKSVVKNS